jgi:hypothetical protein
MKLTKNIIAGIYDEAYAHSTSKLATLSKAEFVNAVYGKVDDQVNRLYTTLLKKRYPADMCIAGIDHNAPDYAKQRIDARKSLAASDIIWNYIDNDAVDVINYVLDNNIHLSLDDWGDDQFGAVVDYNDKKYIVTAHFSDAELEAHEDDYGELDWDDLSHYTVKER